MKKEDFFEVLGELDDGLVRGAERPAKKKMSWKAWGIMAACLALACAAALFLTNQNGDEVTSQGIADIAPMVYVQDTLYKQSGDQQSYPEKKEAFFYLGEVERVTTEETAPDQNFQANHPIVGCEIYQYGESIVVKINGSYWLYVKLEQSH